MSHQTDLFFFPFNIFSTKPRCSMPMFNVWCGNRSFSIPDHSLKTPHSCEIKRFTFLSLLRASISWPFKANSMKSFFQPKILWRRWKLENKNRIESNFQFFVSEQMKDYEKFSKLVHECQSTIVRQAWFANHEGICNPVVSWARSVWCFKGFHRFRKSVSLSIWWN